MSKQHTTDNARALVALALDTSEPADCIKSIRRLFSLGGGAKPKVEAWQPTALQVASYAKIDSDRRELLDDDRVLLGVFIGWRHSAELRESQEMTGISLCRYCHVPVEPKRVDMSIGDTEMVQTIEVTANQPKIAPGPKFCVCGCSQDCHYAAGSGACYVHERNGGPPCHLFTSIEDAEQAKSEARASLPAVRAPRW